jgi:hypothetical protein
LGKREYSSNTIRLQVANYLESEMPSLKTLREFIESNPLGAAEAEAKRRDGSTFFGDYIPASSFPLWFRLLSKFTRDAPLRYWDREIIEKALSVLETDTHKTISAIMVWKNRIGMGFDYLLRRASIEKYEDDLSTQKASDLLVLANEFQPEYLRRCEHIFTNLVILYWAVLKKGSVQGTSFDITGAVSLLKSKGCELLLSGYDEKVRNGIAHGQVVFGLSEIQYGDHRFPHKIQDDEFLYTFDTLWRTSNSLAIAILLFIARNRSLFSVTNTNALPTSIISLIASAETEREGLSVQGIIESEIKSGYQLYILTETIFNKRESVMLECSHIALRLLDAGAVGYSRFVFAIHQGTEVDSMMVILPEKLIDLQNEPYTRFNEILESDLIWTNESPLQNKIKGFRIALLSNIKLGWMKFISEQQEKGLFLTTNRYYIKRVKNSSAGGLARAHVFITLRFAKDANSPDIVRKIILDVINKFGRRRFAINPSKVFKNRRNWYKFPEYIWVSVYRDEGPIRWVVYGGWLRKNLIAMAEKINHPKFEAVFVKKPDEIWQGIRFQYQMDIEAAARSYAEVLKLAHQVNQSSNIQKK